MLQIREVEMRIKSTKTLVTAAVFIAASAFFAILALDFTPRNTSGIELLLYGSSFFPFIILGLLVVFSGITIIRNIDFSDRTTVTSEEKSEVPAEGLGDAKPRLSPILRVLVVWFMGLVYYLAWRALGFLLPSIVFVLLIGWFVGQRSIRGFLILALSGAAIWALFEKVLRISLSF